MSNLAKRSGSGNLIIEAETFPVTYSLIVHKGLGGMQSAQGRVRGDSNALFKAFEADGVKLSLENGDTIDIAIRNFQPLGEEAEFIVSGPVS